MQSKVNSQNCNVSKGINAYRCTHKSRDIDLKIGMVNRRNYRIAPELTIKPFAFLMNVNLFHVVDFCLFVSSTSLTVCVSIPFSVIARFPGLDVKTML